MWIRTKFKKTEQFRCLRQLTRNNVPSAQMKLKMGSKYIGHNLSKLIEKSHKKREKAHFPSFSAPLFNITRPKAP